MITTVELKEYRPYHVSDTENMLDELKSQIEQDLASDSQVVEYRYIRVQRINKAWADQTNNEEFDGDPVISAKWDRSIVYEIERVSA